MLGGTTVVDVGIIRLSRGGPTGARDVEEHGQPTVGLVTTLGDELDPGRHPLVGRIEILDWQEQADATAMLMPYDGSLLIAVRLGE